MNSSLKAEIRGAMSWGFLMLTGGRLNKCCACRSMNANWIDAYGEMSTTAFSVIAWLLSQGCSHRSIRGLQGRGIVGIAGVAGMAVSKEPNSASG